MASKFERTEEKDFTTERSVQELSRILDSFIDQSYAKVETIETDPSTFANGEPRGVIEVVLFGNSLQGVHGKKLPIGIKEWALQVYIFEFETYRYVNTIAMGKSGIMVGLDVAINGLFKNDHTDIGDSRIMQERLISLFTAGDETAQEGILRTPTDSNETNHFEEKAITYSDEIINVAPVGSELFSKMISQKDQADGQIEIDLEYNAFESFRKLCYSVANKYPEFPNRDQLYAYVGHIVDDDDDSALIDVRNELKQYMDMYPDKHATGLTVVQSLFTWKNRTSVDAALMLAGFSLLDTEATNNDVNAHLKRVMQLQLNGESLDEIQEQLWLDLAWFSDFGEWYLDYVKTISAEDANIINYSSEVENAAPAESEIFGRLILQSYNFDGKPLYRLENAAFNSYLDYIEAFTSDNGGFPARNQLLAFFGHLLSDDDPEKDEYQSYMALYPDMFEAARAVVDCLDTWNGCTSIARTLLLAGFSLIDLLEGKDVKDVINQDLEFIMEKQIEGMMIDLQQERLWTHLALLCDFPDWYFQNYSNASQPDTQKKLSR